MLDFTLESQHVKEVVSSIFHTVLLHRTFGKISYKKESTYSIGSLGIKDNDCSRIDFTYCSVNDPQLAADIEKEVSQFHSELRGSVNAGLTRNGVITLEFYERKKARWPFAAELFTWETWDVKVELVSATNTAEQQRRQEVVGCELGEKVFYITQMINKGDYVPKTPDNAADIGNVYMTKYQDIQPFLFKTKHCLTTSPDPQTVSTSVRKLLNYT